MKEDVGTSTYNEHTATQLVLQDIMLASIHLSVAASRTGIAWYNDLHGAPNDPENGQTRPHDKGEIVGF